MLGRSGLMLLLAVGCGLAAMFGVRQMMAKDTKVEPLREVLVAARDLGVDESLKPDMVKVVKMPESQIPAASFGSFKDIEERWVRIPLLKDEPILDGKLAPKGTPPGLPARIPKGMRAIAVEVNEQTGVSGFILPDYRVDVVQAHQLSDQKGRREHIAETVLQDVLVLAAGATTTRPDDKSIQVRTVTLALTPDQVSTLVAAKARGPLSLVLRGINDHAHIVQRKPEPEPEPEPIVKVEPKPEPVVKAEPKPEPVVQKAQPRRLAIIHGLRQTDYYAISSNGKVQGSYSVMGTPSELEETGGLPPGYTTPGATPSPLQMAPMPSPAPAPAPEPPPPPAPEPEPATNTSINTTAMDPAAVHPGTHLALAGMC